MTLALMTLVFSGQLQGPLKHIRTGLMPRKQGVPSPVTPEVGTQVKDGALFAYLLKAVQLTSCHHFHLLEGAYGHTRITLRWM